MKSFWCFQDFTGTRRHFVYDTPHSKVHGANLGPIWGRQDPVGPHIGPIIFAIWDAYWTNKTAYQFMMSHTNLILLIQVTQIMVNQLCDHYLKQCCVKLDEYWNIISSNYFIDAVCHTYFPMSWGNLNNQHLRLTSVNGKRIVWISSNFLLSCCSYSISSTFGGIRKIRFSIKWRPIKARIKLLPD